MTDKPCAEIELMLQADHDGELDATGAAAVAAHVAHCAGCAATQAALTGLSARLRTEVPYHAAPASLRDAVMARIAAEAAASAPMRAKPPRRNWFGRLDAWMQRGLSFGAGAAVAAALVVAVLRPPMPNMPGQDMPGQDMPGQDMPGQDMPGIPESVVASHIRALQPGHLMDVVSTDQHTVKPWFDGRLDYAPPVHDLAAAGFPLLGGRLDYLAGRAVAALVYGRDKHVVDLYVWPARAGQSVPAGQGTRNGYNYVRGTAGGMVFWAVSDLNAAELAQFVDAWRAAP